MVFTDVSSKLRCLAEILKDPVIYASVIRSSLVDKELEEEKNDTKKFESNVNISIKDETSCVDMAND